MAQRYVGRILPGQDLCDVNGDKVGSVSHVYREDESLLGDGHQTAHDEVIEVKTGIFGLGERLYVPVSAVDDATESAVFVDKSKAEFEDTWRRKPEYLDRLN
jgi:hypothetical protein